MKKEISAFDIGILENWDATEIAEKIKKKEISAKEVLSTVKERAEKTQEELNAIVSSNYDLNEIKSKGVFAGVPLFVKDLIPVKGLPNRMGSKGMPDKNCKKDDKLIPQLNATGCHIIGKSATSEFGLLPSCETYVNGDTQNPHKVGFSTGGSSGGAAALVAAGVVPIAHTMDGGGSTRIPASCCGLIGLKPSRGRHIESPTKLLPIDIVTHGIVSRSVRDTANYYQAIEQFKKHATYPEIGQVKNPISRKLKIGMFTESPVGIESHDDVKDVVLKAGKICENLGHEVEYIRNPYSDKVLLDFVTYYSMLAKGINSLGRIVNDKGFQKKKVELFTKELGSYFNKLIFLSPGAIKRLKKDLVQTYNQLTEEYDILLSPTLAQPVPPLGYFGTDIPIIATIMRLNNYVGFTIIQNATGAPAISLPLGRCKNGLPIGPQFATKLGDEKTLLELAFQLEAANVFEL